MAPACCTQPSRCVFQRLAAAVAEQLCTGWMPLAARSGGTCLPGCTRVLLSFHACVCARACPPVCMRVQVAGQQGAYLAHLINSRYTLGVGGYRQPPPFMPVKPSRLDAAALSSPALQWLREALMGGRQRIQLGAEVRTAPHCTAFSPCLPACLRVLSAWRASACMHTVLGRGGEGSVSRRPLPGTVRAGRGGGGRGCSCVCVCVGGMHAHVQVMWPAAGCRLRQNPPTFMWCIVCSMGTGYRLL